MMMTSLKYGIIVRSNLVVPYVTLTQVYETEVAKVSKEWKIAVDYASANNFTSKTRTSNRIIATYILAALHAQALDRFNRVFEFLIVISFHSCLLLLLSFDLHLCMFIIIISLQGIRSCCCLANWPEGGLMVSLEFFGG